MQTPKRDGQGNPIYDISKHTTFENGQATVDFSSMSNDEQQHWLRNLSTIGMAGRQGFKNYNTSCISSKNTNIYSRYYNYFCTK